MKLINKYKNYIILLFLIVIYILFNIYYNNYIGKSFGDTLTTIIAVFSFIILFFTLFPVNKDLIKNNKYIFFLPIYILILELIFMSENKLHITNVYFFSLILIIYITTLLSVILPKKYKNIYSYIIIVLIPVYMISQDIYFSIFSDFFSIKEIVTLKEGMEFASGVIHLKNIYLLYILLMIIGIFLNKKFKYNEKIKLNYKMFLIPIIFFILIIFNMEYPVKEARLYTSDSYLYEKIYSKPRFISRFGVTNYIFRDITESLSNLVKFNNEYKDEINKYFKENKKNHSSNKYSGIFKDKNLIFIVAESFDYIALNDTLTPNITKLMNEGIYFNNYNVPVYPRTTCDTEIIYNTGLIPSITEGPTCYTYNRNSYNISLANLFKNSGYVTNAFHSNSKEFYTRNLVYKGLGYDNFYGQDELKLNEEEKRYDSVFFEKAKDLIINKNKFMSFIITLSGHSPYNSSHLAASKHYEEVKEYYKNDNLPEEVLYYISSQKEVDEFVKSLMNELENKNILNDTVIIFTTDHYPYTINKNIYREYTSIKDNYLKTREPLIIWSNGINKEVIDKTSSSFDIIPTIANLFDLKIDYTYYFGNDILDDTYNSLVYYKDYSWFDGDNYVQFGNKITGNGNKNYIKNTTKKIDTYFDVSKKILESDYFKYNK